MERKKTSLIVIGIFIVVLSVVGVTYAFWQFRTVQTNEDKLASSCFQVTLTDEKNPISLPKAYPMLDSDGEALDPYTFTITNTCNTYAGYQINLESLGKSTDTESKLNPNYLKVKINEEDSDGNISKLGNNETIKTTLSDAYESHKLMTGYLGPNESRNFELRLWLDGDLTMENTDAMNKTFASKVTVTASYLAEENIPPTVDLELAVCDNTISAIGMGTANGGKEIKSYDFKLDTNEWTSNGEIDTKEFTVTPGSHTVSLKVIDNKGISTETSKTVEIISPNTVIIADKEIPLATCMGLFEIEHKEETVNDTNFSQTEYRYAGANYNPDNSDKSYVHNFVRFNEETWRIIGFVNVKTNGGKIEQRLKIILDNHFEPTQWDSSGGNDWTQSRLKQNLNDWNYYENDLKDDAKKMIDEDLMWSIGAISYNDYSSLYANQWYAQERVNMGSDFSAEWPSIYDVNEKAKVGLMYPSDYGYAVGGFNRSTCLTTALYNWNNYRECYKNDWLYSDSSSDWLLTPDSDSGSGAFGQSNGRINIYSVLDYLGVRHVVYLKSNVHIKNDGNDGSYDNPYELELVP